MPVQKKSGNLLNAPRIFGKFNKECGEKATPAKKKKMVARNYNKNYLQFAFISTEDPDFPRLLYLLFGKKLSNQATVLSKLKRHFEGKHDSVAHKDENFFAFESRERKAIAF